MKDVAIEVRGLGKEFIINHKNKASYSTIKDDLANLARRPFGHVSESSEEVFWALKDVGFDVPRGEIFGVVGQNGSGKSTLLKILSRIITPTEGNVTMRGRVSSLLEVGTGFHPELTGRENVYFNGSMLGMSKKEIGRKFDEIVAFSEIEKFIDTPVKFYSSGMYVRLAFAVAAHLDPDILILDEVLAVGDAAFQQKSLTKILETMQDGKTVLFVSHSMGSVRQLCTEGIYLEKGRVLHSGKIDEIIEAYSLDTAGQIAAQSAEKLGARWKNPGNFKPDCFVPQEVYVTDSTGKAHTGPLSNDRDYWLNIEGDITDASPLLTLGYSVWDQEGRNMLYMSMSTDTPEEQWPKLENGRCLFRAKFPAHLINAGVIRVKIISSLHTKRWVLDPDASQVKIELVLRHGHKPSPRWAEGRGGLFAPAIDWNYVSSK